MKNKVNYCVICGNPIKKLKTDSWNRYFNKQTCSSECRNILLSQKKVKDLSGNKYGKLLVIKDSGERTKINNVIWECKCDCGNITYVAGGDLTKKTGTKSCGCLKNKNTYFIHKEGYVVGKDKNNKMFIFDKIDFELIKQYTWNVDSKGYAMTGIKRKKIALHRLILNIKNKNITVDHINRDRWDNRRENLRICTLQQNLWNKGKRSDKEFTSKYIGVSWHKNSEKWRANIRDDKGIGRQLGSFNDQISAAKTYDEACLKYHGEYAILNFPNEN